MTQKILDGGEITDAEAYSLLEMPLQEVLEAAAKVHERFSPRQFDSCSIINARSGRCGEDCKWCAQSQRHGAQCDVYPMVSRQTCLDMARRNREAGIGRFSLVTSGRALSGSEFDQACAHIAALRDEDPATYYCASMGLLDAARLRRLKEAGVTRYHCNLETAPSHFPSQCSTHGIADKMATLRAARAEGLEVCSGGIIGMGETLRQRVEFALKLREVAPQSIPVNVLHPIPGTPLADMPPLSDEEILLTVAVMRLVHPRTVLRFAGGRDRISPSVQREALRIGINGAIMGDLLTTLGAKIEQDKQMVREAGYIHP